MKQTRAFGFTFFVLFFVLNSFVHAADVLIREANKAAAEFRRDIEQLAVWAENNSLDKEGRMTRLMLVPERPNSIFMPSFPMEAGTLDLPKRLPAILPRYYAAPFLPNAPRIKPKTVARSRNNKEDEEDKDRPKDTKLEEDLGVNGSRNTDPSLDIQVSPEMAEYLKQFDSKEEMTEESKQGSKQEQKIPAGSELSNQEIWQIQFRSIRVNYAKRLEILAKRAVKNDRGTLAIQMAIAGLQANPDNALFRNVFGFIKYKRKDKTDEWRTPWEAAQLKTGFADHPVFGWIPENTIERYEKGERYCNGKWVSAQADKEYHQQNIKNGWQIPSEHYDFVTTHSLEEGVRLSRIMEDCYRAWHLLFFRYTADDRQLASLFDSKMVPLSAKRHRVNVYKDKAEYDRATNAPETGGLYVFSGKSGLCHFPGGRGSEGIMYHEGTHQLFHENRHVNGKYGTNEWLVEGAATFMETYHKEYSYYVFGNKNSGRVHGAASINYRYPLEEYSSKEFKFNGDGTYKGGDFYNHSCALFHFFMFHDDGEYRDALVTLLRLYYNGMDNHETLLKLTKQTYTELETQFDKYLKEKE